MHEAILLSVPVAKLREWIQSTKHGNEKVLVTCSMIACLTARKFETLGPLSILKKRTWGTVLDCRGQCGSTAESAVRMLQEERLLVLRRSTHTQTPFTVNAMLLERVM